MTTSISLVGAAIFPQTSARGVKQALLIEHRTDVSKSTVDAIDMSDVVRRKGKSFQTFYKEPRRKFDHLEIPF